MDKITKSIFVPGNGTITFEQNHLVYDEDGGREIVLKYQDIKDFSHNIAEDNTWLGLAGTLKKRLYTIYFMAEAPNTSVLLYFQDHAHELLNKTNAFDAYTKIVEYYRNHLSPLIEKQKREDFLRGSGLERHEHFALSKMGIEDLSYRHEDTDSKKEILKWDDFLGIKEKWHSCGKSRSLTFFIYSRWEPYMLEYRYRSDIPACYYYSDSISNKVNFYKRICDCMTDYSRAKDFWIENKHFVRGEDGVFSVHNIPSDFVVECEATAKHLGVTPIENEKLIFYNGGVSLGKSIMATCQNALIITNKRIIFRDFKKKLKSFCINGSDLNGFTFSHRRGKLIYTFVLQNKGSQYDFVLMDGGENLYLEMDKFRKLWMPENYKVCANCQKNISKTSPKCRYCGESV